jgi:DnaJ-class molecular chaperone
MAQARSIRMAKLFADPILGALKRYEPSSSAPAVATPLGAVKPSLCTVCHGSGDEWRCPDCNGKGTTLSYDPNFPWVLCRSCGGHHSKIGCSTCLGAGRV